MIQDLHYMTDAGLSQDTALGIAKYIERAQAPLVTKLDLELVEQRITAKLSEQISGCKEQIAGCKTLIFETKSSLLQWMVGLMVAQTGIILTLVKLMLPNG